MEGRGSLLWVAGAAAAVALAAWAWRREQQVAAAAAATSGAAGASSPVAAPKLDSKTPAAPTPDEQQAAAAAAAAAATAAAEQQAARERAEQERAAAARRRSSPLYRVTPNERIVHEMLLSGQEGGLAFLEPGELEPEAAAAAAAGAPTRMAAGRSAAARSAAPAAHSAAAAPAPSEEAAAAEDVRRAVVSTVEQAFFDALAEGLRRGKTKALASLLLDARDQLAALLPQHPPGGSSSGGRSSEGTQLLAELREKLDGEYVAQRLERYDAAFASQCFDFLMHMVGRLQAPARRQHTQEAYAEVAALFAAAAQADTATATPAAPAAEPDTATATPAAPAAEPSSGSAAGGGDEAAAAAGEDGRVQLQLSFVKDSQQVAVRLLPAVPPAAAAPAPAASAAASAAGGGALQLEWQLRLAPRPDGGMAAVLVPVEVGSEAGAAPTAEAQQASGAGGGSTGCSTSGSEGRIGEGSIAALVAAARFMHHQLNELKADVAAARLSLLKEAILGNGSAIEYERQRYLRALPQPGDASGGGRGSLGSGSAAAESVADACPLTAAWLKETLHQVPPPAGPDGPALTQAAVENGLLLLLQRTQAVGPADCPETLLLDLEAVVVLQNELQRLCLVAASLLVVQQILAAQRALPPASSPRHAALCQRLVRRVGLLLSSGANLEALAVELHAQIEQEISASGAEQQAAAGTAGDGEGVADSSTAASGSGGGGSGGGGGGSAVATGSSGSSSRVELATVRRMIEGIFSTSHTVYQRVQAGIVAALTALLRSAAAAPSASAGGSRSGSPAPDGSEAAPVHPAAAAAAAGAVGATCRKVLRGVGAEALAPEVLRLGAALHRIASVSSAVAGPVVYAPLLAALQAAAPTWQRRRH